MRAISDIFWREFRGYFRTPVAYVFLIGFQLVTIGFPWFFNRLFDANDTSLAIFFGYFPWIFAIFIPAAGMRLWSEERKTGTWEWLLTLPVSTTAAVLGKFLAGWAFVSTGLVLTASLPLSMAYLGEPDPGPVFAGYLMGFLMAGSYLSLCSFISSLTRSQVTSFVLSVVACLILVLLGWSLFNHLLTPLPVAWVDAIADASFTTHFESAIRGLIRFEDISFFLLVSAFFLSLNVLVIDQGIRRHQKLASAVLVTLIAFALIYLGQQHSFRWDTTEERHFTLSPASEELVADLDRPLVVEFYFSRSAKDVPIRLKNFAERVEGLLRQYAKASAGRLVLRSIDPPRDSLQEMEAERLGLHRQRLGNGQHFYFGLAAIQGPRESVIPLFNPKREPMLEYDLTKALLAVQARQLPKLGVLSVLPVFGDPSLPPPMRSEEEGTAEWQAIKELRNRFELVEIDPRQGLPEDLSMLLVIHPTQWPDSFLRQIDRFVQSGRPMIVTVDPFYVWERFRDRDDGYVVGTTYFKAARMPLFFESWGIEFGSELVADAEQFISISPSPGMPPADYPLWMNLRSFFETQPIVAGLNTVHLREAGALQLADGSPNSWTPLLQSSERASLMEADEVFGDPYSLMDQVQPAGRAFTFAAILEGHLPSPFTKEKNAAAPDRVEGRKKATVAIIADTDWLHNDATVERIDFSGQLRFRPANDNIAFLLNLLEYLEGRDDLISIRRKRAVVRPFTLLAEMNAEARSEFAAEETAVLQELDSIKAEIEDLRKQRRERSGLALDRQIETELSRARQKEAAVTQSLRSIRRELRLRLEAIERRLLLFNFALAPTLVILGGVVFFRLRSMRQRPAQMSR